MKGKTWELLEIRGDMTAKCSVESSFGLGKLAKFVKVYN